LEKKIENLKEQARKLKSNINLLIKAFKHPKTPWYAKIIIFLTVAYAFSPIDLIPDFIPILGYLDDLLIVPAGISLSIKLIPKEVIDECKEIQEAEGNMKKSGVLAAIVIAAFWLWIITLILKALQVI